MRNFHSFTCLGFFKTLSFRTNQELCLGALMEDIIVDCVCSMSKMSHELVWSNYPMFLFLKLCMYCWKQIISILWYFWALNKSYRCVLQNQKTKPKNQQRQQVKRSAFLKWVCLHLMTLLISMLRSKQKSEFDCRMLESVHTLNLTFGRTKSSKTWTLFQLT